MHRQSVHVLTIFPAMFEGFLRYGMVKRAVEKGHLRVAVQDIREAAEDRHRTVDDTPYGGGAGMVMKPDILSKSLNAAEPFREGRKPPVILMTPQGKRFDQALANEMSMLDEYVLVCGRYRAIDERFRERYVTGEISVGDYVLSGGEPAAMVVIDAIARLIPGVLGDFESGIEDSFQNGILDSPWYTRPEEFEGLRVPGVLLTGNHREIEKWRQEQAYERTRTRRPDLLKK